MIFYRISPPVAPDLFSWYKRYVNTLNGKKCSTLPHMEKHILFKRLNRLVLENRLHELTGHETDLTRWRDPHQVPVEKTEVITTTEPTQASTTDPSWWAIADSPHSMNSSRLDQTQKSTLQNFSKYGKTIKSGVEDFVCCVVQIFYQYRTKGQFT